MKTKVFTVILSICSGSVFAQMYYSGAENGFQFLEQSYDCRIAAMGGAGSAQSGQGFSLYNPAMIGSGVAQQVAARYGQLPGDLSKTSVEATLRTDLYFAGFSAMTQTINNIVRTTEQGEGLSYSAPSTVLSLGAGFIRDAYRVGVCVNGFEDRVAPESPQRGLSISAGGQYDCIPGMLTIGIAAFHQVLSASAFSRENIMRAGDPVVPRTLRAGAVWTDTIHGIGLCSAVDLVYKESNRSMQVPIGIEVQPIKYTSLRLGKKFDIGRDLESNEICTIGLGITYAPLSVDLVFVPTQFGSDTELAWNVGVTWYVDKK